MNIPDKIEQIQEKDIPTLVERALKEGNPLYPVPKIMNEADCEMVIRRPDQTVGMAHKKQAAHHYFSQENTRCFYLIRSITARIQIG